MQAINSEELETAEQSRAEQASLQQPIGSSPLKNFTFD
jgi:hypothetical protein